MNYRVRNIFISTQDIELHFIFIHGIHLFMHLFIQHIFIEKLQYVKNNGVSTQK